MRFSFFNKSLIGAVLLSVSKQALALTCVLSSPSGTFNGYGANQADATHAARAECLQALHNGRICSYSPVSCYGYNPAPNPYNPYQPCYQQIQCRVTLSNGSAYFGRGCEVNAAVNEARQSCAQSTYQSGQCWSAPFSCFQP